MVVRLTNFMERDYDLCMETEICCEKVASPCEKHKKETDHKMEGIKL